MKVGIFLVIVALLYTIIQLVKVLTIFAKKAPLLAEMHKQLTVIQTQLKIIDKAQQALRLPTNKKTNRYIRNMYKFARKRHLLK